MTKLIKKRQRKHRPRPNKNETSFVFGKEEEGSGYEALGNQSGMERAYSDVGQAKKSARGMPWHQEPMKDATSCEKLRGAANKL